MMFAQVSIGSLALAAFYTVVDLQSSIVGMSSRGNISEGSDLLCVEPAQCASAQQTYYPPRNLCIDPDCSEFIFMRFDANSKTCVWSTSVPVCLLLLLIALVGL